MTPASAPTAPVPHTVLVVEDAPTSRERIARILEDLGCRVLAAADGLEGVKMANLHAADIDLVVLDIQMPVMDGITALRYMRQIRSLDAVPIVMLTTQVDAETVRTALRHKATDFIRKDASIPKITERFSAYLQGHRGVVASAAAEMPELDQQAIERIILGCRRYQHETRGPYVLVFESSVDSSALGQGKDRSLAHFYLSLLRALERINARYPGLEVGYDIESSTKEVTRVLKRGAPEASQVIISGRRSEGEALAHLLALMKEDARPPLVLMYDGAAPAGPERADASARRRPASQLGVFDRSRADDGAVYEVLEQHVVPAAVTTPSGLQYYELAAGAGPAPRPGQRVTVRCARVREDGTQIRGAGEVRESMVWALGQGETSPGLDEGVALMSPGGRALLVMPPTLALGAAGEEDGAPADAAVRFSVELVAVA